MVTTAEQRGGSYCCLAGDEQQVRNEQNKRREGYSLTLSVGELSYTCSSLTTPRPTHTHTQKVREAKRTRECERACAVYFIIRMQLDEVMQNAERTAGIKEKLENRREVLNVVY